MAGGGVSSGSLLFGANAGERGLDRETRKTHPQRHDLPQRHALEALQPIAEDLLAVGRDQQATQSQTSQATTRRVGNLCDYSCLPLSMQAGSTISLTILYLMHNLTLTGSAPSYAESQQHDAEHAHGSKRSVIWTVAAQTSTPVNRVL